MGAWPWRGLAGFVGALALGAALLVGSLPVRAEPTDPALAAIGQLATECALEATAEARTACTLDVVRFSPPLLGAFLRQLPKGADLHNHLSGAVYAESLIAWAAEDGLCVEIATLSLTEPPCEADVGRPTVASAIQSGPFYGELIDAWSMRFFVPGEESGHDHFFATFDKFGAATRIRTGDMVAEVSSRAAAQNEIYLELMVSFQSGAASQLGRTTGWDGDAAATRQRLIDAGLADLVAAARQDLDLAEARRRQIQHCGTPAADPGCDVTVRYLAQTNRLSAPAPLFAQFTLAFELFRADPRIVGLNLVAPEDDPRSLANYTVQMQMLDGLWQQSPDMNIALHAGELTLGLVPPEDLRFHIRQAVEIGHARRIGHGVAVLYEDNPFDLLDEMARRRVLVEINLTSNDQILGVSGIDHPFPVYRAFGVPTALSTDDEGVSRIDLTHEYQRATESYGLSYADLKELSRNSLEYSFLPGESLWAAVAPFRPTAACAGDALGAADPSAACRSLLVGSERARAQWNLEARFTAFETLQWTAPSPVPSAAG